MGQMSKAIQVLMTLGFSAGTVAFMTGCQGDAPKSQATGSVTDVRPIEPAVTASYQSPSYQPPLYDTTSSAIPTAAQPISADPVSAAPSPKIKTLISSTPKVSTIGEKTHTVLHGETLFSIARASYGDGKAWKKIVSANPGVSPAKLRVGQVLVMPQS